MGRGEEGGGEGHDGQHETSRLHTHHPGCQQTWGDGGGGRMGEGGRVGLHDGQHETSSLHTHHPGCQQTWGNGGGEGGGEGVGRAGFA